jgi:DNA-binding transcriptional regulator YhcF (GntR family)
MADRRAEIARSLRQRILSGLHLGTLKPGMRLPSTRDLADEFGVTPRTAMAAYRLLENEGLVELRERSGIYVAGSENGHAAMLTQLAGFVVEVLLEARAREIAPAEFPERARRCLETLRLRAVCIAGNADQLDQICHELQSDYGVQSTALEPEQLSDPDYEAQRALSHADLLVSTAVHAVRVKQVAHQLGKPTIAVSLREELWNEFTRHLARGPIYIVASDPRFREAVRAVFEPTGFGDNARAVILGEDDPDQIPADAPTYIMRRAHERLGNSPLAQRVVPFRRIFSAEMSRELLTFIVRANIAAMSARMS